MNDILNFLKENGINETITIGSIVDDNGVGLFSTSGLKPTFFMDNTMLNNNGLQVIVRNRSYLEGETIINNIFALLNSLDGYNPQQSPFFIGKNENDYAEFSVNYIIMKEGVF